MVGSPSLLRGSCIVSLHQDQSKNFSTISASSQFLLKSASSNSRPFSVRFDVLAITGLREIPRIYLSANLSRVEEPWLLTRWDSGICFLEEGHQHQQPAYEAIETSRYRLTIRQLPLMRQSEVHTLSQGTVPMCSTRFSDPGRRRMQSAGQLFREPPQYADLSQNPLQIYHFSNRLQFLIGRRLLHTIVFPEPDII
jgi:hypothetical protein